MVVTTEPEHGVTEPDGLERLVKGRGGVSRHTVEDSGDVVTPHLPGSLGIAQGQGKHGINGFDGAVQKLHARTTGRRAHSAGNGAEILVRIGYAGHQGHANDERCSEFGQ